jgi:tetratricopeptide (TPR) repeat protein
MLPLDCAGLLARVRACREAGEYPRADAIAASAIAAVQRVLGPDSRELAVLINERGIIGKHLGRFADSERHYRRALAIYTRHGEVASADVAAILHNLGGLAHERGDHKAAYAYARRGLEVREALAEPDPLALAQDRAALAAVLVDLHRYHQAQTLLAGALATYQAWYGPWHYEVGVTLHNLGALAYRRGQAGAAADTLRRAYEVKRAVLGARHPDLAITLYAQARCSRELGDPQRAAALLRQACDLLGPVVPPDQPTLAACRRQLAELQPARRRTRRKLAELQPASRRTRRELTAPTGSPPPDTR